MSIPRNIFGLAFVILRVKLAKRLFWKINISKHIQKITLRVPSVLYFEKNNFWT